MTATLDSRQDAARTGRRRAPLPALAASVAVAGLASVPLAFIAIQAFDSGPSEVVRLLDRPLVATLLWNTVRLTAAVTIICAVIGTAAAFCVECCTVRGRGAWAVLIVLPLAIPEFVVSYAWVSIAPSLHGFNGAVLVMVASRYPLVYLPVAAALRGLDPTSEDTARSLGLGPWATFWRVTLPQLRPGLLGGCLLVSLYMLAEYGAFALLRFTTFTTAIYTEYKLGFNLPAASALAMVLVALSLLLLAGEARATGRARYARVGSGAARVRRLHPLGRMTFPVALGGIALVALCLGVPIGSLAYWLLRGSSTTLPSASIGGAAVHTLAYSLAAAALATALALPVAILAVRHRSRLSIMLERSTYLARGIPGVVVGLAFVYFAIRYLPGLYQSGPLLVVAYALVFLPVAVVAVRSALQQISPELEDVAHSLGHRSWAVFRKVTFPLLRPGLAAGFALVFLSSVTELTATLLLRPTGVETLSTQFWVYTSALAYGAAAPYAAMLVVLSAIPTVILTRRINAFSGMSAT